MDKGLSDVITVMVLVSLVLVGVVIVWMLVSGLFFDFKKDTSSERVDEQLGFNDSVDSCEDGSCEPKCVSDWRCGEWGVCSSNFDLSDLISNSIARGFEDRICLDDNGCALDKIEKRECDLAISVVTKKVEWCGEDYVEIYEKDNLVLVSRVKEGDIVNFTNFSKFDVSFLTGNFGGYCSYCFDSLKNFDEIGIDCGGENCPECVSKKPFVDWLYYVIVLSWMCLAVLLLIYYLITQKKIR